MGLFGIFKKKTTEEQAEEVAPVTNSIIIEGGRDGSHGDHFGALLGFEKFGTKEVQQMVHGMLAAAVTQQPVMQNADNAITNVAFKGVDNPVVKTVLVDNKHKSGYPHLQADTVIAFETKKIVEWEYIVDIEADIEGVGKDTFGIGFFPVDYAVKMDIYKSRPMLHIRLSAFAYTIQNFEVSEADDPDISPDFVGYFPNKDLPGFSYFDFVGKVLAFETVLLREDNVGYIITIKLINEDDDPNFFVVDAFVNQANMRLESELTVGMSITGLLWFQGEIAEEG